MCNFEKQVMVYCIMNKKKIKFNLSNAQKKWVEEILEKFDFVQWDRLIAVDINTRFQIYGWIKRKKSKYKDFLVLNFTLKKSSIEYSLISSSSEECHTKFEEIMGLNLQKCRRVEDYFKAKNIIKLNEKRGKNGQNINR